MDQSLGKPLCKGEQMSNWELRPLRKSQMHYAALDAACLPPILKILAVEAAKQEHADLITLENFTKPLIFGKKLDVPDVISDPSEKKDNKKDRRKRKRGPRRKKDDRESATDTDFSAMESTDQDPSYDPSHEEEEKKE